MIAASGVDSPAMMIAKNESLRMPSSSHTADEPLAEKFANIWAHSSSPPDVFAFLEAHQTASPTEIVDVCALDISRRWQAGTGFAVEQYFERLSRVKWEATNKLALVVREFQCQRDQGLAPEIQSFASRFPEFEPMLRARLGDEGGVIGAGKKPFAATVAAPAQVTRMATADMLEAVTPGLSAIPVKIGRYRVDSILGEGGFGRVYLGYDEVLKRRVAIKVPRRRRQLGPDSADAYLREARIVAGLDHPAIVPVYDCGQTDDGLCFVVSKYIEGSDLATKAKRTPLTFAASAALIATVAEALHSAHLRGIVHRDIKPANILIDLRGCPFVADFGIALSEDDYGRASATIGTILYMSPEQIRGEGHLVDGRSDIFSLGVVLYELLTGRRPFAYSRLAGPVSIEPRPPRQINDLIPRELERVCLKAISNRVADRYSTAADLTSDLRLFLTAGDSPGAPVIPLTDLPLRDSSGPLTGESDIRIVPKGLRSFDREDAGFFLGLLPGPRDRSGIPDNVRFWKTRIQESAPEATFRVGIIYGPSGSGKSSFLKAGVIPLLSDNVESIYVESTPQDTEARLLNALKRAYPGLPPDLGLAGILAAVRREQVVAPRKLLIVLDQFEQWLHARRKEQGDELTEALRQCDGTHLQCIVTVRDDFWMAVTHFMDDLEIPLVPDENVAAVDLWGPRHAKMVLTAIGQAYGELPAIRSEITAEQKSFINLAIGELAHNDHIVPVQLSLFAQMVKDRSWIPSTLKEVGGAEGLGETFLDETFNGPSASPSHRLHQKAARAVLGALLSDQHRNIKGSMRSYQELLDASGYAQRPKDFDSLIRILNSELRLITPTDPEGLESAEIANDESFSGQHRYFHLAHDYLVPSLRAWLTRKQKETRRGRAELLLAERSVLWNAKPKNRHLPSLWEYLNIRLLTDQRKWTSPQRKMMIKSGRFQAGFVAIAATSLVALAGSGLVIFRQIEEKRQADQAAALVKLLMVADPAAVPATLKELDGYRRWADPLLREEDGKTARGSSKKVNLALGLLPVDQGKIAELTDDLLLVSPSQFSVVLDALRPFHGQITEPLWKVALDAKEKSQRRFQAACALANYAFDDDRWNRINKFVADRLVTLEASALVAWREGLRPAGGRLIKPLALIYRDSKQKEQSRSFAAETLAEYAADRPDELFNLLADAEQFQFPILFDKLLVYKDQAVDLADQEIARKPPEKAGEEQKELLAKRQANAAVALLRLGVQEKAWRVLKFSPDPRVRSYFVHWVCPLGGDPLMIIRGLEGESDVTIRRALVLTLGELTETQLSAAQRQPIIEKLWAIYENEPDAGLHSALEWLLRKWGQRERLEAVVAKLKCDEKQLQVRRSHDERQWYVNSQKQTFVIMDAGEFFMGSPKSDPYGYPEVSHRRIGRRLAIATTEVTQEQFGRFQTARHEISKQQTDQWVKTGDSPQTQITWYEAAAYCDWLSEREGIPKEQWCYERNKQRKYAAGMKAKDKFWELTGYRLPTEAEWEFACRAGTLTSRYYGLTESLLAQYTWYQSNGQNRTWPIGSLKPNDKGLFDMLGNAWEWCFDLSEDYPQQPDKVVEDMPTVQPVEDTQRRVLRGGAFNSRPENVRSAHRVYGQPVDRNNTNGFRPARTYR
jgi:serine/threonine protein kinase/formylglycine-generating enzyme required for sulfatase activity